MPVKRTVRELACAWELEFQSDPLHRGPAALPAEKRPTWISVGGYKANHPLVPSGLFGPTRLVIERH